MDGEGTVLITENCQLNKNRNPNLTKADVEKYLNDYIGVTKAIWLNGDIPYDETDGHIDGLACFIRPGVVMATTTQDKNHADYEVLNTNLETLKNSTDAKGRKLEIIEIDQPAEYIYTCPMNFYFANGAVIIPAYNFPEYDKYVRTCSSKPSQTVRLFNLTQLWFYLAAAISIASHNSSRQHEFLLEIRNPKKRKGEDYV